jgi:His/Glu/Gln/Arg/opine family amino acid ABC transporter permease subunit
MDFEMKLFLETLPALAKGAVVSAKLAAIAGVLGLVIGTFGGLARISANRVVRGLAAGYVLFIRGVPLLMTMLFLYYGLPALGLRVDAIVVAVAALSVTSGAYITEIVRAGIQSIDRGQLRAARSLGMSYPLAMRRIVLPQAMRRVVPPLTNEAITLLKNTALVSVIAISDLLRVGVETMVWTANTFSPFVGVAIFYLLLTVPLIGLNEYVERRFRVT